MADKIIYTAACGGNGFYRNRNSGFEVTYYSKKEMKDLYPAGGFKVVGQLCKGKKVIGACESGGVQEDVYRTSKMPHTVIKGYVSVGNDSYLAVVKDVLLLWILLCLFICLLVVGAGLLIKHFVPANAEPETTRPLLVLDDNAVYGEGELTTNEHVETKGRKIKINGVPTMTLKANTLEQNFVFSNPEGNPCYFIVEVVLESTGEVIYTSNLLPPGYSISHFTLNRALAPGQYKAVVHFKTYSFDKEQRPLNKMDSKTTIKVTE